MSIFPDDEAAKVEAQLWKLLTAYGITSALSRQRSALLVRELVNLTAIAVVDGCDRQLDRLSPPGEGISRARLAVATAERTGRPS